MSNVATPVTDNYAYSVQLVSPLLRPPYSVSTEQINTIGVGTLSVATEPLITFPRELHVTEAVQFLRDQLHSERDVESIMYRVNEVDHGPGFVIDLLVLTPETTRDVRRSIFTALGGLMRAFPYLLFDFRIVRRRGRSREEIIPEDFSE